MVKKVFQTEWFSIEALEYSLGDGQPYYRLSCDDSVFILAMTPRRRILLIEQFRPAIGKFALEFPAGHVDLGETPKQAMTRELLEETGYECGTMLYLGPFRIANSRVNSKVHAFFSKDARPRGGNKAERGIKVLPVTEKEFRRLISCGKFDAISGIGLYSLAKLRKLI